MSEQTDNLDRVSARIGLAIRGFYHYRRETGERLFFVEELRRYVIAEVGIIAPASPDRVMRLLRKQGVIHYTVVSRRESLYRIDDPPQPPHWSFNERPQGTLF
jgi:hypothetical protein